MKSSRRSNRMERNHKRNKRMTGFNLVSLMDIFTILVFFLLVNSSEVEVLPNSKSVALPESVSEQKPKETVLVLVTNKNIIVQGKAVASIDDVMSHDGLVIESVRAALESHAKRALITKVGTTPQIHEVTIMGDKEIPYSVLKKIMVTCTKANYEKISLTVIQKTPKES